MGQIIALCQTDTTLRKTYQVYTWEEIKVHNQATDCWVVINGGVYNLTEFLKIHPGGSRIIWRSAGKDCSDDFNRIHTRKAYGMMSQYHIGSVN